MYKCIVHLWVFLLSPPPPSSPGRGSDRPKEPRTRERRRVKGDVGEGESGPKENDDDGGVEREDDEKRGS